MTFEEKVAALKSLDEQLGAARSALVHACISLNASEGLLSRANATETLRCLMRDLGDIDGVRTMLRVEMLFLEGTIVANNWQSVGADASRAHQEAGAKSLAVAAVEDLGGVR